MKSIYINSVLFAITFTWVVYQGNLYSNIACLLLFPVMFVTLILSVIRIPKFRKRFTLKAYLPLVVCLLAVVAPVPLAIRSQEMYFRSKIPELEKEIQEYRSTGLYPNSVWQSGDGANIHFPQLDLADDSGIVILYKWGKTFRSSVALAYYSKSQINNEFGIGNWSGYSIDKNWFIVRTKQN